MLRIRGRRVPKILDVIIGNERFAISSSAIEKHFSTLWDESQKDIRKGQLHPKWHARFACPTDRNVLMHLFEVLENHDNREVLHPSDRDALIDLRWITESSEDPSARAEIFRSLAKLLRDEYFGCHTDMAYQLSQTFLDNLPEIMMAGLELWLEYVLALDFVWKSFKPNFMEPILELVVDYGIDPLELQDFWKRAKIPLRETMVSVLGHPPDLISDLDYPYSDYASPRSGYRRRTRGQRLLGPIPELYDPRDIYVGPVNRGALPIYSHLDRHRRHHGGGYHQVASLYEDRPRRPRAVMP
ncbi:MAG: hypothetical protein LQ342_004104 [Letrouitia transgressa]|nr:MAG: hypothetical protein LQ342_004104 [Letrouitia transgressa]